MVLESLVTKYEVIIFTTALREYASMVLDWYDQNLNMDRKLIKDLFEMGRELKLVIIINDNSNSSTNQPENKISIWPFVDDIFDCELWKLRSFFDGFDCYDDMRDVVKHYIIV
ncbi:CTD small phosphatase protein [Spatholobus suberectus]|nr:CTD small phosphatase protein [Spatholobus suberectus]